MVAEYASKNLVSLLENTAQWKEYQAMSAKARKDATDLMSQALVQTFVDLDNALRKLSVGENDSLLVREIS
jgi:hypothetical protein